MGDASLRTDFQGKCHDKGGKVEIGEVFLRQNAAFQDVTKTPFRSLSTGKTSQKSAV